ncbi:phage major capsid protein [Alloyangia pacifica]|uniref:Phage major capsid protein, HK97 family n=1 Tax=Alloyangia pacifica TaxID=311180 RepID=A0A1I6QJN2_9RHOB|nr:phage major capsid protein [Alloyangia pacifica]SDF91259.1 phage major capsid protein, HK97 family [Alloyangia pacifica]SFS52540.1 phage major capsid protein, HK97 family [Alloyangia pacifica]
MSKHMTPAKARGIIAVRAETGDVAKILANLQKDWQSFKDTQAEKDKEVSAKFDDVVTTEKFARIDASVGELQSAVDQANAQLAAIAMQGGGAGQVVDAEYSQAFLANFRKGDINAALNKGADDEGGYLAPVEWDRTITDKLVEVSPMRQIASVQRISKAGFTKLFNLRGTGSGWVGEEAARGETATPTFGTMTITPGEIYANPGATQGMLDDAEVDLEAWIAGEVETEFAKQEGAAFVAGDGTNKPAGFLSFATGGANAAANPLGAIEVLDAASTTAVTEDELLDLIYAVPSAYTSESRFTMNRTSMGKIRKLRDADGRQLWQPSSVAGQPSTLLAYPLTEMADMPDMAAGAMGIAFGNFRRGYLIVDRAGVRVLRDPFTAKPKVLFYTTKRVGGAVTDPTGIKVLKQAAA